MRNGWRWFTWLIYLPIILATEAEAASAVLGLEQQQKLIAKLSAQDQRRIARESEPVFVFIPGILGSKLTDSNGNVIWGKKTVGGVFGDWRKTSNAAERLRYDPKQKITAHLLYEFEIPGDNPDEYGKFFKEIRFISKSGDPNFIPFGYDWRGDIKSSAESLHNTLMSVTWNSVLDDRDVIFISHSMGGLVLTSWYNDYYKGHEKDYPFDFAIEFIFMGSPHWGAVSTLNVFIDGYYLESFPDWYQKIWEDVAFKDLNLAGHTFPSLYQMLPYRRAGQPAVMKIDTAGGMHQPVNVFSHNVWQDLDLLKRVRKALGRIHSDRNKDKKLRKKFYDDLKTKIDNGFDFLADLDTQGALPRAKYFYNNTLETPSEIVVIEKRHADYEYKTLTSQGDGRVLSDVATNVERIPLNQKKAENLIFVDRRHFALPNGGAVLNYLTTLASIVRDKKNELLVEAPLQPQASRIAADNEILLPLPKDPRRWHEPIIKKIIDFNKGVIDQIQKMKEGELIDAPEFAYKKAKALENTQPIIAGEWYSTALALDRTGKRAFDAANNASMIYRSANQLDIAEQFAVVAESTIPTRSHQLNAVAAIVKARNNLGVIMWNKGEFKNAEETLKSSENLAKTFQLNPSKPAENLKLLQKNSSVGVNSKWVEGFSGKLVLSPSGLDNRI